MKENDKSELLRETLLSTAIFFHNLFLFHLLYSRVQTCSLFPAIAVALLFPFLSHTAHVSGRMLPVETLSIGLTTNNHSG